MRSINVSYVDQNKKGIRPNGEKLPIIGGVRTDGMGYKGKIILEILNPVNDAGAIHGICIMFDGPEEYHKIIAEIVESIKPLRIS